MIQVSNCPAHELEGLVVHCAAIDANGTRPLQRRSWPVRTLGRLLGHRVGQALDILERVPKRGKARVIIHHAQDLAGGENDRDGAGCQRRVRQRFKWCLKSLVGRFSSELAEVTDVYSVAAIAALVQPLAGFFWKFTAAKSGNGEMRAALVRRDDVPVHLSEADRTSNAVQV